MGDHMSYSYLQEAIADFFSCPNSKVSEISEKTSIDLFSVRTLPACFHDFIEYSSGSRDWRPCLMTNNCPCYCGAAVQSSVPWHFQSTTLMMFNWLHQLLLALYLI